MSQMTLALDEDEPLELGRFAEKAYLDYSMYVILDRALPSLADGLKPVQRRIVYAMSELGLSAASKPKKSARTVGDVLGKFHPHGDSACYEAMVLMAQPFSTRYPLVEGQGNWGSPDDPKSFAAMRYTEAKLTPYARLLLAELAQGTVDWVPNFDGTLSEPTALPARLPNVLLNGASGIAVGMATDVPPHNLREVAAATVHLLDHPKATVDELCELMPGPDYPTEAEIVTPADELVEIYRTGSGSVRTRARWTVEDGEIVVTALPHHASPARILEGIAAQMQAKKLPMVEDLRDESDHEHPTRLVIVPRSNRVDVEALMSHLFASTDLERTHRVNLNVIGLDGRPRTRDLASLLGDWLEFRRETVRRRLRFRLDKVLARIHVLEGLLVAYLNLDEVIRIIRTEDEPKPVLIERFDLSDAQAEAILETKLRHLARLEEMRIRGETDDLLRERAEIEDVLGSATRLRKLIRSEIETDAAEHGDERRSPLVEREEARALSEADLLPTEPVTVVLSDKGWVRAGKGHDLDAEGLPYRSGDRYRAAARGRSNQSAIVLDSTGRAYSVPAHTLPSARGHGEPLTGRVSPPAGAEFVGLLMGAADDRVLLASQAGYGFVARVGDLEARNRSGKAVLTVPKGSRACDPQPVPDVAADLVLAVSDAGRALAFPVSELPEMARGKGNKILALKKGERMVGAVAVPHGAVVRIHAGKQYTKLDRAGLAEVAGSRGLRGTLLPKNFRNVDRLEVVVD